MSDSGGCPSAPHKTIGGVLDIDPDTGLRLELTDQLLPGGLDPILAPVIHGHADGREVTLLDCMPAEGGKTVIAQTSTTTQVSRPRVAMVGVHLADAADAVFAGMEVSITGLTPWAATSGLHANYIGNQQNNDRLSMIFRWTDPIQTTLPEPTNRTLSLRWHSTSSGIMAGRPLADLHSRVYRVEEQVVLRITSPTPHPWNGFGDNAVAVRNLMTVATQLPCRVTERTLLMAAEPPLDVYRVDLYFRAGGSVQPDREEKFRELVDMGFTLRDFDFGTVIHRWFEIRNQIGMPLDVLLGLDYQPGGYYENRLFNAAASAEGFHAALCPATTALPEEAHTELTTRVSNALTGLKKGLLTKVTTLLESLPAREKDKVLGLITKVATPAHRAWVMNKLGDNRPGLMARYEELAAKADDQAVNALLTDVKTWAQWLRDARNAIGHVNTGRLTEKIPDEDARYYLVSVTRALLHLVVLAELGVSAETQRRLVNDEWNYIAQRFRAAVRNRPQARAIEGPTA